MAKAAWTPVEVGTMTESVKMIAVGVVVGLLVVILTPVVLSFVGGGLVSFLGGATKEDVPMVVQSVDTLEIVDGRLPSECAHLAGTLGSGECDGPGCAARVVRCDVTFDDSPFGSAPEVTLALAGFDTFEETGGRLRLELVDVTQTGFRFDVITWHDSRVWGVWVNWMAVWTPSE